MKTINDLKNEFNNITLLKCFEIEVTNKETNENEYILFDIELRKNTLFAFHVPMTKKQERSKKIAFQKITLDKFYSLQEHFNDLFERCTYSIIESEFYNLY
jgi:hypothetical protein